MKVIKKIWISEKGVDSYFVVLDDSDEENEIKVSKEEFMVNQLGVEFKREAKVEYK